MAAGLGLALLGNFAHFRQFPFGLGGTTSGLLAFRLDMATRFGFALDTRQLLLANLGVAENSGFAQRLQLQLDFRSATFRFQSLLFGLSTGGLLALRLLLEAGRSHTRFFGFAKGTGFAIANLDLAFFFGFTARGDLTLARLGFTFHFQLAQLRQLALGFGRAAFSLLTLLFCQTACCSLELTGLGFLLRLQGAPFGFQSLFFEQPLRCSLALPGLGLALRICFTQCGQFPLDLGSAPFRLFSRRLLPLRLGRASRLGFSFPVLDVALGLGFSSSGLFVVGLAGAASRLLALLLGHATSVLFTLARLDFPLSLGFAQSCQFPLRLCGTAIGLFALNLGFAARGLLAMRFHGQLLCDLAQRAAFSLVTLSLGFTVRVQFALCFGRATLGVFATCLCLAQRLQFELYFCRTTFGCLAPRFSLAQRGLFAFFSLAPLLCRVFARLNRVIGIAGNVFGTIFRNAQGGLPQLSLSARQNFLNPGLSLALFIVLAAQWRGRRLLALLGGSPQR